MTNICATLVRLRAFVKQVVRLVNVLQFCHHEGDDGIEQEGTEEVGSIKPGGGRYEKPGGKKEPRVL